MMMYPNGPQRRNLFVTLDEVADYYFKNLPESKEAKAYLEGRGLWNPEILKRLKVGYCKGDLRNKVSDSGFEKLKEIGIFTEKVAEHFKGCITFPLFDSDGRVSGIYGRKINSTKPQHLYLKGPHRGLLNRKAIAVYHDSVIITESVIDAVSLIALGIENAVPAYGVNGFTDEHLKAFKDNRVKEAVIAFDADTAGREASIRLKEKLSGEGISAGEMFPPNVKDWNES